MLIAGQNGHEHRRRPHQSIVDARELGSISSEQCKGTVNVIFCSFPLTIYCLTLLKAGNTHTKPSA